MPRRCAALRRMIYERLFFGIAVVSLLSFADPALFILGNPAVGPVLSAQDLTPRVDTLWTKLTTQTPWVDFTASAMGGNPRGFIVATVRREEPQDKYLVEYDVETGVEIRNVRSGHYGDAQYMTFARNANVFATAEAGLIKVWRWPELEVIREFTGNSEPWPAVLLTSDGKRLFDAHEGVMYDVATGDTLWRTDMSWNFAYPKMTPDDRLILVHRLVPSPSNDYGLLLDAETGEPLDKFYGGSGEEFIAAMAISDDGRYVAVSRLVDDTPVTNGSVYVYDRQLQQIVLRKQYSGSQNGGYAVTFTPNATGLLVMRSGMSDACDIEWLPSWQREPQMCFAWMGANFSSDFRYNFNGIGGRIAVSRFNLETVSVEESEPESSSTIFPNPTDGTVTIHTVAPDGPVRFEITLTTGQVMSTGSTSIINNTCSVNPTPKLAVGSYFLRLTRSQQLLFSSPLVVR
ncbi:MAG: hypothetical protein HYX66_03205 [Ignavibacteria bacterium]|nr:hypothetical protein [Ignavibacteria bacterium]